MSKEKTVIEIDFPEEKLWDKSSACIEKFPVFNGSNKTNTQREKTEINSIQMKEKRKFETFAELFKEKSNPSVTEKKKPSMLECLDDSYDLIFSASKKHRFDDQVDSEPDYLAQYLIKPSTSDSKTPHSSKNCAATNEVNKRLNDMSVHEKNDPLDFTSQQKNKEIQNDGL